MNSQDRQAQLISLGDDKRWQIKRRRVKQISKDSRRKMWISQIKKWKNIRIIEKREIRTVSSLKKDKFFMIKQRKGGGQMESRKKGF